MNTLTLITNDHKEPYSKLVPHKNSSPTKSQNLLKLKIFPIIYLMLPQSLILNIEETISTTRLLTIIGTKIYQPPQKKYKNDTLKKARRLNECQKL